MPAPAVLLSRPSAMKSTLIPFLPRHCFFWLHSIFFCKNFLRVLFARGAVKTTTRTGHAAQKQFRLSIAVAAVRIGPATGTSASPRMTPAWQPLLTFRSSSMSSGWRRSDGSGVIVVDDASDGFAGMLRYGGRGYVGESCSSRQQRYPRSKPERSPQRRAYAFEFRRLNSKDLPPKPRSLSGRCRAPSQIVRHHVYHDRRQTQHHPDPEHRRMVDASPVARRRCRFHLVSWSVRRMSSMNGNGLLKTRPCQGRFG